MSLKNHHRPFQPVEAEDMPVELGVVVVKGLPVLGNEFGLEGFLMNGMPFFDGEKRDLVPRPTLLD